MKADTIDDALNAVKTVYGALTALDEDKRAFVLRTVGELLGTSLPLDATPKTPSQPQQTPARAALSGPNATIATTTNKQTAKEFLSEKNPVNETQQLICLAYYLTNFMGKPKFKTKDLRVLNAEAGGARFSNPSMTAANAERQGKLLSPGGDGQKQITRHGEDLVKALPDQEAVKQFWRERRKSRKRRSSKAPAK